MSEIPTNNQLNNWYDKVIEIPSFLDTLTLYQKDELRIFTEKQVDKNFQFAVECSLLWKEENFPKGLPVEKRINHILFVNLDTKRPILVLNLLGWHWTPEKRFFKLEKLQQSKNSNKTWKKAPIPEINPTWELLINEGIKLTNRQIALICHYEPNIVIPKPSETNDIAKKIAVFHGHTSGLNLYNNHALKVTVKTDRLNQHTPNKTKKDIEKIFKFLSTEKGRNNAKDDLAILEDRIKLEEN